MTGAPPPVPGDDKDWTWVLESDCPECGFSATTFAKEDVATMIRDNSSEWSEVLGGDEAAVTTRRDPALWSTLEYACHVRDVHVLYLERLNRMLSADGPHYANWDQDITAVEKRYDLADPAAVGPELVAAGEALASRFETVDGQQWERTGYRSDGAAFTVETFAKYFIHDPIHHMWDVQQG